MFQFSKNFSPNMALLLKIHGFLGFPCENPPSVGQAFAVCLATYPIHKASGVTKKTVQLIGTPGGRPTAKRDTGQGLKQQDIESLRDEKLGNPKRSSPSPKLRH